MGCQTCIQKAKLAAAKLAASKTVTANASGNYNLAQLLVMLNQIEASTEKGVTYRAQWASRLAKRRKSLFAVYPDRAGDFDAFISTSIPSLSASDLNAEAARIKTIVAKSGYIPPK